MDFYKLLLTPFEYAQEQLKEIVDTKTGPAGSNTAVTDGAGLVIDHIDTVNDLIAYQMLAEHHAIAGAIRRYTHTNQWIHNTFI